MTDTIFIHGILIHARHGVLDHESEVGQRFVIDLELSTDLGESSRTDRLKDTVFPIPVLSRPRPKLSPIRITICSNAPQGPLPPRSLEPFPA